MVAKSAKRSLTIIFKGTTKCNAGCRFCSAANEDAGTIGFEDFEVVVRRIEEYVAEAGIDYLSFTFHGGEPTLLGAEFLDRACLRLRRLPIPVGFTLQSNLLAFPNKIIDVVHRHAIHVGSSVDPIQAGRCLANGGDCFPVWVRNRRKLAAHSLQFGSIFLVTKPAVGQGKRVYDILNACSSLGDLQTGMQFNLVYPQGRAAVNEDILVTPEEGGQFLVDAYHAWEESGRESHVSPFNELMRWFETGRKAKPQLSCWFAGRCNETHLGIDEELNVAGCGRRLDCDGFFGNLRDQSIAAMLAASDERRDLARRSEKLAKSECSGCEYFPVCHGGCPDDGSIACGDIMARSPYCVSFKMLFETMSARAGAPPRTPPRRPDIRPRVVYLSTSARLSDRFRKREERMELWILPTGDGRTLKYDAQLQSALDSGAERVRLYVPAAQMKSLLLWSTVLGAPGMEVVLFDEPASLLDRLGEIGRLGARARLDIASLFAAGWTAAEAIDLVDRYLHEPDWKVRIEPFESILMAGAYGERVPLMNRHSLPQGRFRVCIDAMGGANEAADALIDELRALEDTNVADYFADHRGCAACACYTICGARLAPRDGEQCSAELRQLADRLKTASGELRTAMCEQEKEQA